MLKLSGVKVKIADKLLLSDIGFTLHPGEHIAITGQSGSGKTTLLRTIAGLIDLFEGSILFKDKSIDFWYMPQYRRKVILLDQQPVLYAGTVRENLERPFKYKIAEKDEFPEKEVAELLGLSGLTVNILNQEATDLSVGQKQRICLIRAILLHPDVLMLDEPISALDKESGALVKRLIQTQLQNGVGILTVTHNFNGETKFFDKHIRLGLTEKALNS